MATSDLHIPVALERCLTLLAPAISAPGAILIDATLGMGGHTEAALQRFPELSVIGIDRDPEARALAGERLAVFGQRIRIVDAVYDEIFDVLDRFSLDSVQGILFDLGVSSLQLDKVERGFSYSKNAPLDMRMDSSKGITAAEVLQNYELGDLIRIFRNYGEEKLAPRYARAIVAAREREPFVESAQLVDIIDRATPAALRRAGHPAKRVFQALRIEVNRELSVLEEAIPDAVSSLALGGRIVVLSYHSLEDRIVKRALQAKAVSSAPHGLPVELPEHRPELKLLVRGSEQASEEEILQNSRAKSVRLRAAERIREVNA
ncbi:MAG: 16S rRNA (cytosine(1402)-N(4))-methyltransferase RsmH [Microbacteriaceae bacterium]